MQPLGSLAGSSYSEAVAINSSGGVVGSAKTSIGARAFVWSHQDGMQDLNNLIPPNSHVLLTSALAINDRGQILAVGGVADDLLHNVHLDDEKHAGPHHLFLLTPGKQ